MRYGHRDTLIRGEWRAGARKERFPTIDPGNGEVLADVARGYEEDIQLAVEAARHALEGTWWGAEHPRKRAQVLYRIAQLIRDQAGELALMESLDSGKPLRQAQADIESSAQYFEFYAGAADKLYGHTIPLGTRYLDYTVREPIGVTGHITPWNYPLAVATRGIAPALAARIKAGQIYSNNYFGGGVAAPFGGYKKSGFGREKGLVALEHYTQVKNVCISLN